MRLIWEIKDKLSLRLRGAEQVFLFSDFDGTLSPITPTPDSAYLPSEIKKLLLQLCLIPKFTLAIISGRSLQNIREMVGIDNIYYAGNHGLEILGPDGFWTLPEAEKFRPIISGLAEQIAFAFKDMPGIKIENKGLSLSLHYRLVPKKYLTAAVDTLRKMQNLPTWPKGLYIRRGRRVYEIRPVGWDKGDALLYLRDRLRRGVREVLFYLGDDFTDEDAFRVLGEGDIGILVGHPKESIARYYLLPGEVDRFLLFLKDVFRHS